MSLDTAATACEQKPHPAKLPACRKELLVFDGKQILEIRRHTLFLFELFGTAFYIGLIGNRWLYVKAM